MNEKDYLLLVRKYLKRYNHYKELIAMKRRQLQEIEDQLASESIKTSRYGNDPGGGKGDMSAIEAAAFKRIEQNQRHTELAQDIQKLNAVIRRVNDGIALLAPEKARLVKSLYIDEISPKSLIRDKGCSLSWMYRLLREAEHDLAVILFGPPADGLN